MKKLLAAVFLSFVFVSVALAADFSDVPQTHDNYLAIKYLSDQGIVKGYSDGTFKPENPVNRAEALKIILESNKTQVTQEVADMPFKDVKASDWFVSYLNKGKAMGIVGGNADGTFAAGRNVARSEFIKMLLMAHNFNKEKWGGKQVFADVPADAWFAPYMNYAGQAGLVTKDAAGKLYPSKALSRAEVAQIIYLMSIILKGKDTQFLLDQSESQMAQIEVYVGAGKPVQAKKASELSVDITQQAYKNLPTNKIVIGAAKLAKAYDFLVSSYVTALQKKTEESIQWANQTISKATEAWEANNAVQAIAKHIKDRAKEIIALSDSSFVRIVGPTGGFSVTGLRAGTHIAGSGGENGKIVVLYNTTGNNMTITNDSGSSTTGNKIYTLTGGNLATTGTGSFILVYDNVGSHWIVTGSQL